MPAAAAQAQAQDSSDVAQCADQGGPSMGSPSVPEQAQEQGSPHIANHPATPQSHHPAAAAAGAPQSSHAGRYMLHPFWNMPTFSASTDKPALATPCQAWGDCLVHLHSVLLQKTTPSQYHLLHADVCGLCR